MGNKIFTIFAGVNGAGKSTLYNLPYLEKENLGIRINTDEIVRTFGDWRNEADQVKAGRIAIKLRKECISKGSSFNQETTLTGNSILKLVDQVKEKGYKIHLYYVGVNSPEIAKERIKNRVAKGGHDIPEEVVEKRYYESLENLKVILPKTDKAEIYDNTEIYTLAIVKQEEKVKQYIEKLPDWLQKISSELKLEQNKEKAAMNVKTTENKKVRTRSRSRAVNRGNER